MPMPLRIGEIVELKKAHPCGSYRWEILRTGIDFRIKCLKCGHVAWISRKKLEKNIKKRLGTKSELGEDS